MCIRDRFIGKDEKGQDRYRPAASTVNKIYKDQLFKADAIAYPKEGNLGYYGSILKSDRIPRDKQDDIAAGLRVVIAEYAMRYDGRGTIDGWINFALHKQFVNVVKEAGVFGDVLLEGETTTQDLVESMAYETPYSNMSDNAYLEYGETLDPRDQPGVVVFDNRLNELTNIIPSFDAPAAREKAVAKITSTDIPTRYSETPAIVDIYTPLGIKSTKIVNEKGEIALTATELGKKDQKKIKDAMLTTEDQIKNLHKIMPEGFVSYNEQQRADGSYINVSDKVAGTATGVIDKSRKEQSPL